MFDNLLHNHTLSVIDAYGQLTSRRATCAELKKRHASHVSEAVLPDGQDGTLSGIKIIDCRTAETERQELIRLKAHHEERIACMREEISRLDEEIATCYRLMAGAMQIVFHMGPALRKLLSDDLGTPELSLDGSAVQLVGADYIVVIEVFKEGIYVRAVNDSVPEKRFTIINGVIDEDSQTRMIGHVTRIKAVAVGGADPVQVPINLIETDTVEI